MDKQKEIDKLAEIMEVARLKARDTLGSMNDGFGVWYATALVNAGIGDTKQAVRVFAEKLKNEFTNYLGGKQACYEIDKLVKEVCGE